MPAQPTASLLAAAAAEQSAFRAAVDRELQSFLAEQRRVLADVSMDSLDLLDALATLTTGGKRFRALLCYWGWRGAGGCADDPAIVRAGVALELFQAAALIHDDIIDRSDTRRGAPSVHRGFTQLHRRRGWHLDSDRFGEAAAILAGDLCLSFSEQVFSSIAHAPGRSGTARAIFDRMRAEVMAGQYLDILEEVAGALRGPEDAVERARNILRFKSAKYSTEHPLTLGGALAGAGVELSAAYSDFALPLGEAFQLRDDILGVFGDPDTTGKPAGDDLREGKRTVLVAYALNHGSAEDRAFIDAQLGNPELSDAGITTLREIMVRTGALERTELLITGLSADVHGAWAALPVERLTATALQVLAGAVIDRSS